METRKYLGHGKLFHLSKMTDFWKNLVSYERLAYMQNNAHICQFRPKNKDAHVRK